MKEAENKQLTSEEEATLETAKSTARSMLEAGESIETVQGATKLPTMVLRGLKGAIAKRRKLLQATNEATEAHSSSFGSEQAQPQGQGHPYRPPTFQHHNESQSIEQDQPRFTGEITLTPEDLATLRNSMTKSEQRILDGVVGVASLRRRQAYGSPQMRMRGPEGLDQKVQDMIDRAIATKLQVDIYRSIFGDGAKKQDEGIISTDDIKKILLLKFVGMGSGKAEDIESEITKIVTILQAFDGIKQGAIKDRQALEQSIRQSLKGEKSSIEKIGEAIRTAKDELGPLVQTGMEALGRGMSGQGRQGQIQQPPPPPEIPETPSTPLEETTLPPETSSTTSKKPSKTIRARKN